MWIAVVAASRSCLGNLWHLVERSEAAAHNKKILGLALGEIIFRITPVFIDSECGHHGAELLVQVITLKPAAGGTTFDTTQSRSKSTELLRSTWPTNSKGNE
jgi:hypothetical protein